MTDIIKIEESPILVTVSGQGMPGTDGVGISSVTKTTSGQVDTYTVHYSDGSTYEFDVTNGTEGASAWGNLTGTLSDQTDLQDALDDKGDVIEVDASGSIVHVYDALASRPVSALSVGIEPVQDLSNGDPSPTNICPITGWTEATVWRTGKNLIENTMTDDTYNGITRTVNSDGSVTFDGTSTGQGDNYFCRSISLPDGTYTLNGISGGSGSTYKLYCAIRSNATGTTRYATATDGEASFTVSNETISLFLRIYSGVTLDNVTIYPMIRLASDTDDTYEQYQGTSVTIDLGGTRYGGTLDVVNGELTVTHDYIASYAGETLPGEWISDRDVYAEGTTPTTGAEVVYELATPTTVTLTAETLTMLGGENVLWADTGDISLTYKADDKKFILQTVKDAKALVSADVTDEMVAPRNLTTNEFVVVNNTLYKVTANTASGATLTPGTNVTATTVAEVLTALLNA